MTKLKLRFMVLVLKSLHDIICYIETILDIECGSKKEFDSLINDLEMKQKED